CNTFKGTRNPTPYSLPETLSVPLSFRRAVRGEGKPHFRVALISRVALTPFIKLTSIKVATPPSPDGKEELDATSSKVLAIPHLPVFLKLYRFPSPLGVRK